MTAAVAEKRLSTKEKKRLEKRLASASSLDQQLLLEYMLGTASKPKIQVRMSYAMLYALYEAYERAKGGHSAFRRRPENFPDFIREELLHAVGGRSPQSLDADWYKAIAELHYDISE